MADFSATMKKVFSKSVKFVGTTAKSVAKATKYKMDELSNRSKRRDMIAELGAKVFELARNGLQLPMEAAELVDQINRLDGDWNAMRENHAAEKAARAEQHAAEKAARAAEKAAAKSEAAIDMSTAPVDINLPETDASVVEIDETVDCVPTLNVEQQPEAEASADESIPTLNV